MTARVLTDGRRQRGLVLYQPPLSLTYHPDFQRKLVTGTLPPRAAADGPDCRRAMTEMESRNQRRLVSDSISLRGINCSSLSDPRDGLVDHLCRHPPASSPASLTPRCAAAG